MIFWYFFFKLRNFMKLVWVYGKYSINLVDDRFIKKAVFFYRKYNFFFINLEKKNFFLFFLFYYFFHLIFFTLKVFRRWRIMIYWNEKKKKK